ncbi:accessory gene regulator ArgB-like protein [Paenibacillus sacheonensis]|uniref:Accessory regulator AgrB n=1 Tax=Paenibacillus sacheonensis TaxID=742054 RepID=A0A7X4YK72_9BACL|nr:accessory gene regulator B family protein [Paenibacillus sacheonensis]MBM7563810.1 accessory gene regulator B [Paenibacillus sacheonensis]NBC67840.1 accessory regulator AgrB [Paenibacillus sacheonensis]
MIKRLSLVLAAQIKQRAPDHPGSIAVMAYSISFIINMMSVILLTLLAGIATGHIEDTITVLVAFALLRQASGGYHLKSGITCIAVSTALLSLLALTPNLSDGLLLAVNIVSIAIVAIFSPSQIEKQTRIPPRYFPLLKAISTIIVASNFFIGSSVLAVTFLAQAATLLMRGGVKNRE